jgi:hypothetical protein
MAAISIDFFGTLDEKPEFWREMLGYVMLEGIEVYVISGVMPEELYQLLEYNGYNKKVHFANAFSIFAHMTLTGKDTWYSEDHDSYRCDPSAYWNSKAEMCRKLGVQLHFDNDVRFKHAFGNVATRFIYNRHDPGLALIKEWHNSLKLANTYDEWEDDYMYMSGFHPMG